METISISIKILGHTHRETISTRNSIAIINHLSLNTLNCFIIATNTYLCLYVCILWSDLESSRMCLWNKIPIPLFGARSNVYHPFFYNPLLGWAILRKFKCKINLPNIILKSTNIAHKNATVFIVTNCFS